MSTRGRDRPRTDVEIAETIRVRTAEYPQKELAELLDVDPSAISRAFAGKRAFNLREVALIADWLGIDADEILFAREGALAWRCEASQATQEDAARRCREALRDYLAFRTVGT
jgi:transcriptional regulator with XRE-family HTH domain